MYRRNQGHVTQLKVFHLNNPCRSESCLSTDLHTYLLTHHHAIQLVDPHFEPALMLCTVNLLMDTNSFVAFLVG